MTPKIEAKGVFKRFGAKVVLDGLDLTVMPGESMVIIGGSGTGKSVTIKSVLGLVTPDKGSIKVDDKKMLELTDRILPWVVKQLNETSTPPGEVLPKISHGNLPEALLLVSDWKRFLAAPPFNYPVKELEIAGLD